ncbi:hypothetical protein [Clostridium drakei]|uniref:Uncharacterized protein n=1 Tax=Clostridium drakei TaxID=332101 RepID=A0A2U8DLC7_9CLOT|nr:hypothetical protein [Clostridium drakei]AWI03473.1 hypothetical protein B9W14_02890 [Clostridium drakei]
METWNEGNSAKSLNGNALNKKIYEILKTLQSKGYVQSFVFEPRYNYPNHSYEQFSPDFEITLKNGNIIIIDNTTTARHDRFKQKQWDAYGTKVHFQDKGKNVEYYIVLPDDEEIGNDNSRQKEINNFIHEKNKNNDPQYFSCINDMIQVSDLVNIITSR